MKAVDKKLIIHKLKLHAIAAPELGRKKLILEFESTDSFDHDKDCPIDFDTRRARFHADKFQEHGMVTLYLGRCRYQIINTQESLEQFRKNISRLPKECFEFDWEF